MTETEKTAIINQLYNLVLDRNIRDWERQELFTCKNRLEAGAALKPELSRLEAELRPLALRANLTPLVDEFYKKITSNKLFGLGTGNFLNSYRGDPDN